jgi:hypothetical protein
MDARSLPPAVNQPFAVCHPVPPLCADDGFMPQCLCCGATVVCRDPAKPNWSKQDKAAQRRRS